MQKQHIYISIKKNFAIKMYRKKVTAKLLITDLLIIVLKFFVLNFKCFAIHVGIENKPDEV